MPPRNRRPSGIKTIAAIGQCSGNSPGEDCRISADMGKNPPTACGDPRMKTAPEGAVRDV